MPRHNAIFRWKAGFLIAAVALLGSAAFGRAQATGSISGRVTDSAGTGIGNIRVEVYSRVDLYFYSVSYTDSEGYYTISELSDGSYVVMFSDGLRRYCEEWYDDKSTYATANPVAVAGGGPTSGINAELTKAGQISGRITDKDGKGISGSEVDVYSLDNSFIWFALADSDGNYVVKGLSTGLYIVKFRGLSDFSPSPPNYIPEWYNDKSDFESADPVSVTAENTTANINAQLLECGKISGRVVDSSGKGIKDIKVQAYEPNSEIPFRDAISDADGRYTIAALLPGSYKIQFTNAYSPGYYYSEWYNDKASFQTADAIAAVSGKTTEILDAVLTKKKTIEVSQWMIYLSAVQGGPTTPPATVVISNSGSGTLNWTASSRDGLLSVTPSTGAGNGLVSIGIARTDLTPAPLYRDLIIVTDPEACNSPVYISVDLNIIAAGSDQPPFGSFDTPVDGTTVVSSIPVTGWALDDVGVQSVKIYYGTNESDRVYIGDAVFIDGARPDIDGKFKQIHPTIDRLWWYYPQDERAGWGYMLLTDFLPNGGNGTFNLLAYATDLSGHEVLLGSKTIVCDNANAVKPFGAIDTPTQGGTASGTYFANFGWVLTPKPNSIPIDGSTLNVWVDGLPLGHPVYNNYRADIATLFPGYANSNGAVGYYYLNTTGYADGVHTIEWSATDSGGNTDGIGSRYFTIQNAVPVPGQNGATTTASINRAAGAESRTAEEIAVFPEDARTPIFIKRGLANNTLPETVLPDSDGIFRIAVSEVTRIAVYLNDSDAGETKEEMSERGKRILSRSARNFGESSASRSMRDKALNEANGSAILTSRYEAYQLVGDEIRPLPIGASFDTETGSFYWQPGPGFRGEFRFVIVDSTGKTKKSLLVTITK